MVNLQKNVAGFSRITSREKSLCKFAKADSRENGSSSMLDKMVYRANKVPADWLSLL